MTDAYQTDYFVETIFYTKGVGAETYTNAVVYYCSITFKRAGILRKYNIASSTFAFSIWTELAVISRIPFLETT